MLELKYNGYSETLENRKIIICYEFVNYGFLENNYSVIIKRFYNLDYEFIRETKFYNVDTNYFKNLVTQYIELQKLDYVNIINEYSKETRLNNDKLNDIINMMLTLDLKEFKGLKFSLELIHVKNSDYKKVNVLKKYNNSSNFFHNQFIENRLFYKSFYKSNKRSFDFIKQD